MVCKCITQLISLFHILNIVENPKKERKEIERVAADKHKRENPSEGKKWQKTEILTGFILFKVTLSKYIRLSVVIWIPLGLK